MAIVATAGTTRVVLAGEGRLTFGFRWLVAAACLTTAVDLLLHATARASLPSGWLQEALVGLVVANAALGLALAAIAWAAHRRAPGLLLAATLVGCVATLRAVLPGLLAALELPTLANMAEGCLGLVLLGLLVWSALVAWGPTPAERSDRAVDAYFRRVAEVTMLVVFLASLSGVSVQAAGAAWACRGFPMCNDLGVLPFGREPVMDIQLYHRLLSFLAIGLVLWLAIEARRTQPAAIRGASLGLAAVALGQGASGAIAVTSGVPMLSQLLHGVGALATWSASVALVTLAHRPLEVAMPRRSLVAAYIQLTKPRVMSLLLATTATAMVVAARGMPPLDLLIATLLGGALMSGGAGAINHYVDRDIDPLMGRTAWRPIPSGVIAPRNALWFGIVLAAVAALVFVVFVNAIAAGLSLLGLLGYVFIYTLWLKRSTPSNIVIGGAAGAIPPMVGWAAVTNEISSLTAWYLFAIIFFWTPPHFWALSLLIRKHYERAGVPMLPVVRGEDETRWQIVLYSLVLVALTLVLSPFGLMGLVYFGAAVVLGAVFLVYAVRLWRVKTTLAARRLYLYSMLYLFVLFVAMAVDRVVSV
jgi:heme o synthase